MSAIQVRRFRRDDRVQLTALVNAHVGAVMPGVTVSVNTVLSQLERDPGEFIVDPWVGERLTLVAEQRQRIVAAAHLIRYRADEDVGADFKNAGEIKWFVFWPPEPYWPAGEDAAAELMAACVATLQTWGCDPLYADGSLPAPGVYGIPAQWPHVAQALERAGSSTVAASRRFSLPMWRTCWRRTRRSRACPSDGRSASMAPDSRPSRATRHSAHRGRDRRRRSGSPRGSDLGGHRQLRGRRGTSRPGYRALAARPGGAMAGAWGASTG